VRAIDQLIRRFGADPAVVPPNEAEEFLYEVAAQELQEGEERPGLMAKAFAEVEGDESKARALYLKMRVVQLQGLYEKAAQIQRELEREGELERERIARLSAATSMSPDIESPEDEADYWVVGVSILLMVIVFLCIVTAMGQGL
jgi:hypothetical protein